MTRLLPARVPLRTLAVLAAAGSASTAAVVMTQFNSDKASSRAEAAATPGEFQASREREPWEDPSFWAINDPNSGWDTSDEAVRMGDSSLTPLGGTFERRGPGRGEGRGGPGGFPGMEGVDFRNMTPEQREEFRERMEAMRAERRAEFEARFDLDGDGMLNDEERAAMDAYLAERRAEGEALRQAAIDRFDLDGDGRLSRAEMEAARDILRPEMIANRNLQRLSERSGSLSAEQLALGLQMVQNQDPSADFNGDGVIDAGDAERLMDVFAAGEITVDPLLQVAQRMMAAQRGRGEGGQGNFQRRMVMLDGSEVVIRGDVLITGPEGAPLADGEPMVVIIDGEPRPPRRRGGGEGGNRPPRNPE